MMYFLLAAENLTVDSLVIRVFAVLLNNYINTNYDAMAMG